MKRKLLNITHLFPDHLNVYGDIGNIIALTKRGIWRDIDVKVTNVNTGDKLPDTTDIYFIGGGEDEEQTAVNNYLLEFKDKIKKDIDNKVVALTICGGFQLFGKYFLTGDGHKLDGIDIFDIETRAPDLNVKSRCIGNLIIEVNPDLGLGLNPSTLVGFENHSGQTYLGNNVRPLGFTLSGSGNNIKDQAEGAVYKNAIGTYMHGSLLPKNPHLADKLIELALANKYTDFELNSLDNETEFNAHNNIINRFR